MMKTCECSGKEQEKGRIAAFQSMGTVDGPGIRNVIFLQGCPLRCIYCHNPETWGQSGGSDTTVTELLHKIHGYKKYIKQNGGVTLSGGEPLLQAGFAAKLLKQLKENGYHTAIDTAGIGDLKGAEQVLRYCDLVICDLKFTNETDYDKYCGGSLESVLKFLRLSEAMQKKLWIRQVIVPGINDAEEQVRKLKEMAYGYTNLEKIELLPFRKLCAEKYQEAGIRFEAARIKACGKEKLSLLQAIADKE